MTKDELFQALKEIREICKKNECEECLFHDKSESCSFCMFMDGGEDGLIPKFWEIEKMEAQDDDC